jgi:hypothetical protein
VRRERLTLESGYAVFEDLLFLLQFLLQSLDLLCLVLGLLGELFDGLFVFLQYLFPLLQ